MKRCLAKLDDCLDTLLCFWLHFDHFERDNRKTRQPAEVCPKCLVTRGLGSCHQTLECSQVMHLKEHRLPKFFLSAVTM